jgi:CheY-like chemotaxis protein
VRDADSMQIEGMTVPAPIKLLLVEDNQADAKLMRLWFGRCLAVAAVTHVTHGWQALQLVRGDSELATGKRPDLVLLDSNLPDMLGLDVLAELRRDPGLTQFDVLILTGTFNVDDAQRARELGAYGYQLKPPDMDAFEALVKQVEAYAANR